MFTTEQLSVMQRRVITQEKQLQLKRQLLNTRRQYARLLRTIRDQGATAARARRMESLEQRMSALELQLAYSEVPPSVEPITLREIWTACRPILKRVRCIVATWCTGFELYMLMRSPTSAKSRKRFRVA